MSRPFAVFDIDGTLIRWQLYHAVVGELAKRGSMDASTYDAIKEARMVWKQRVRGDAFKDYERVIVEAYDTLIANLEVREFEAAVEAVFAEHKNQAYTYTRELLHSLQHNGYLLFAISNSHQEIVAKVAEYYKFDDCLGTVYQRKGNRFTGQKEGFFTTKHLALQTLIDKHQPSLAGSIAVGDSESDIPMLEMVEQPMAFNPTKALFEHAKTHNWPIVIERKNVIYKLEVKNETYQLT